MLGYARAPARALGGAALDRMRRLVGRSDGALFYPLGLSGTMPCMMRWSNATDRHDECATDGTLQLLSLLLAHVFISQAVARVSAAVAGVRSVRFHAINVSHQFADNSVSPPHTPLLLDELVRFPRGGWVPGQNIHSYIDKLFDSVDEDHDGGISIEDFMNASFCYT